MRVGWVADRAVGLPVGSLKLQRSLGCQFLDRLVALWLIGSPDSQYVIRLML